MTDLTSRGYATARELTAEDLALAVAALNVEAELREEGYAALEMLGSLVAGSSGPLTERVAALPDREFFHAACALLRLGWIDNRG